MDGRTHDLSAELAALIGDMDRETRRKVTRQAGQLCQMWIVVRQRTEVEALREFGDQVVAKVNALAVDPETRDHAERIRPMVLEALNDLVDEQERKLEEAQTMIADMDADRDVSGDRLAVLMDGPSSAHRLPTIARAQPRKTLADPHRRWRSGATRSRERRARRTRTARADADDGPAPPPARRLGGHSPSTRGVSWGRRR